MKIANGTIALVGLLLLLVSCADRVDTVRNTEETALKVLSISPTPGWAQNVFVSGDAAFVADSEQWVGIWDISQKENPRQIDTMRTLRAVSGVYYSPQTDLLFVDMPGAQGGITYYDLSEKRRIATVFDTGVEGWGIREISKDTVIVAEVDRTPGEGLRVFTVYFDLEDSLWADSEIREVHPLTFGIGRGLHYDDEYAYIAHSQFGLTIAEVNFNYIEILITELGNVDTPGGARDIALNRDRTHAIVADYQAGISIIDITDKSNPVYVSSLLPEGVDQMSSVFAVGDTTYAIDNNRAIFAFDVSSPTDPKLIARYDTPAPKGIFVTDDHTIFLADEDIGLIILGWRD